MAQPKPKSGSGEKAKEIDKSTLNVSPKARALLSKIAALRDKSMKELFEEKDISYFFEHLYDEELRKEQQRSKANG